MTDEILPFCVSTGHHICVKTIRYSLKKCIFCNKRCLFRLRKMLKCGACKDVMHIRCLVLENHNSQRIARIRNLQISGISLWREYFGGDDNYHFMSEDARAHVIRSIRDLYLRQLQEEIRYGNSDGQMQAEDECVKDTDGNGDGQVQTEDESVKGTDSNGGGQMQIKQVSVKGTDSNGDGQVKVEDGNVKAMVVHGGGQIRGANKIVKAKVGGGQIEGKGEQVRIVRMPIIRSDQFQKIRVLGVIALLLGPTNDVDIQKSLQKMIRTAFQTVHPVCFAIIDSLKLIWITRSNPKNGSCAEEYRQQLSAPLTIADTLTALDYVQLSQSWVFEKKNGDEFSIVYGLIIINSAFFDN